MGCFSSVPVESKTASGEKNSQRKMSWGPQVPVDSALEAALMKAESRIVKVPSNSLEARTLRRWSTTHQEEYKKDQKKKNSRGRNSITAIFTKAKRAVSSVN